MNTLFPDNCADSVAKMDEKMEVQIARVTDEFLASDGADALIDMLLPTIAANEAEYRKKFGDGAAMFGFLEEYRERVRLGLREPLPGVV
jgi:hypothetical protein